ncbi:MAG TPA: cupin domain-containing protein [Edaphobacter sp.]
MHSLIRVGDISVTFIKTRHETHGALDLFEMTLPPHTHMLIPHLHRDYDESIIGINGITTWTVDGKQIVLHRGEQLFIPRGAVHSYSNRHKSTARTMCILTPGLLGPEYFHDLAAAINIEGTPNMAEIGSIMARYGVVPVAPPNHSPSN